MSTYYFLMNGFLSSSESVFQASAAFFGGISNFHVWSFLPKFCLVFVYKEHVDTHDSLGLDSHINFLLSFSFVSL
eukprot:UN24182